MHPPAAGQSDAPCALHDVVSMHVLSYQRQPARSHVSLFVLIVLTLQLNDPPVQVE